MNDAADAASELGDEDIVVRTGELLTSELDGELVGLSIENGVCYGFNKVATRIWDLLAEPRTVARLCDELTRQYDVEPDTCRREVDSLLSQLRHDRLISIRSA